jgi:hypothetical protein
MKENQKFNLTTSHFFLPKAAIQPFALSVFSGPHTGISQQLGKLLCCLSHWRCNQGEPVLRRDDRLFRDLDRHSGAA